MKSDYYMGMLLMLPQSRSQMLRGIQGVSNECSRSQMVKLDTY